MSMLGDLLKVLAIVALDAVVRDVRKEYGRWIDTREQVEQEIKRQEKEIKSYLSGEKKYYQYAVMKELHYQSFRVADEAYKLLADARMSINALNRTLMEAKERRNELYEKRKTYKAQHKIKEMTEKVDELNAARNKIFEDRDILLKQKDEFERQVKTLNYQTHQLKNLIRDKAGKQGREWYDRLEERKRQRHAADGVFESYYANIY
jgi:hypothetical protein